MLAVTPSVDGGLRPVASVVGEPIPVTATVFREGHDAVNASVAVTDPAGTTTYLPMTCTNVGLSRWEATIVADREGLWSFTVEGWSDPYGTWHHDAVIKVEAGIDVELMLEEGARVLERAIERVERSPEQRAILTGAIAALRDTTRDPRERLYVAASGPVEHELTARPLRELVSPRPPSPGWWSARSPCAARGTRSSRAPRAPTRTRTAPGTLGRCAQPPSACPRSPRWASTSSTSRRSTPSAPPTARAPTTR